MSLCLSLLLKVKKEKKKHEEEKGENSAPHQDYLMEVFSLFTFPKGETNCWSAVILSPIFSFFTW